MATVKAELNSLRMAPRKVRAVVNLVKGKNVEQALERLEFLIRRPADPVAKLIRSALANAENNFGMVPSNMFIKEFWVDEGMKLKRYRAAGFGRPREIQKKTSHVRLVLAEKVPGMKSAPKAVKEHKHDHDHNHDHAHETKPKNDKLASDRRGPEIKTELGKKSGQSNTKRRWFQRKSV